MDPNYQPENEQPIDYFEESEPINLHFHGAQAQAIMSDATETFLIGGVGLGKSFFLGAGLYNGLLTQGAVCGLFAPTTRVLQKATLPQIRNCWNELDFVLNRDFVINRKPPDSWGVEPFSPTNSHNILTTKWGSYCLLDGLLDPQSQRGIELDEIFVDEYRDVNADARDVLLGRLRGRAYKNLGLKHRIWYATTPPDDVSFLRKLYELNHPEIKMFFGASHENPKMPKSYLELLKNTYDDITYRREVLAELITYSSLLYFCAFDHDKTVKKAEPDFRKALYLSFDFNIDPMTCLAAQHSGGEINILKEWFVRDSQIPANTEPTAYLANLVKQYAKQFPALYITGDSSGKKRDAVAKKGTTNYTIIGEVLKELKPEIKTLSTNPELGNSRAFCNSILQKHKALNISPLCKHLIHDFGNVKVKQNNGKVEIDKGKATQKGKNDQPLTHISDCFRYYLHTYHSDFMQNKKRIDISYLDI